MSSRPQAEGRERFKAWQTLGTRWMDNDVYGHINNVQYYSFFDTAVNGWLIAQGVLDIHAGDTIGLVVHTQCHYFAPLAFPQPVQAGLRVAHIGRSSVRYALGLFAPGQALCAASGEFVHVYVHRHSREPVAELPSALRQSLEGLQLPDA